MKQAKTIEQSDRVYTDIHMPKNTSMGVVIGGLSFVFGFAIIWHIWWLAALGLAAIIVSLVIRLSDDDTEYVISAAEIEKLDRTAAKGRKFA